MNFEGIRVGEGLRHLSKDAFMNGMGKFCRDLRSAAFFLHLPRREYGRKNGLRRRGSASKLFLFFLRIPPLTPTPPQRLFVRCLKVSAPVALKASDKKESFGIMVILQVVKRSMSEKKMQRDKRLKRYKFARKH